MSAVDLRKRNLRESRTLIGGRQHIYKFPNGYGASVVSHFFSYGGRDDLWELAVVEFGGEDEWHLTYDTPITDDVIGWLSERAVNDLLRRIAKLPALDTKGDKTND